jgi:hypothetical protein
LAAVEFKREGDKVFLIADDAGVRFPLTMEQAKGLLSSLDKAIEDKESSIVTEYADPLCSSAFPYPKPWKTKHETG